ncbi:MAG: hypothetical protein JXR94_06055 [Candidatus Hydrogenedentes bacterium]|nr:hypothetical protein [Candidatus Hydrogenedentota bacterium]
MHTLVEPWDYLVITASNAAQAAAYEAQLAARVRLGFLSDAREVLVVADPGGRRIGSGGSTVHCLATVLRRELSAGGEWPGDPAAWEAVLRGRRILIVHAGGDSKRLPVYGPCGKLFVPVPGDTDRALCTTLFDRQIQTYLALPPQGVDCGQVVIVSGDALLEFDPRQVRFDRPGITGLAAHAAPEQAAAHGVFCEGPGGAVRLFLQKPSPDEQREHGAVDRWQRTLLDVGVTSFDAATAVALLETCGAAAAHAESSWSGPMGAAIDAYGLDFYLEVCCALGTDATPAHHAAAARRAGSAWPDAALEAFFNGLSSVPFHVQALSQCSFLHFGTLPELITSGQELAGRDRGGASARECIAINNDIANGGRLVGADAWVEGCRVRDELQLPGGNVVAGLDVDAPLSLPRDACLDVIPGTGRDNAPVYFVRCYCATDGLKASAAQGAALWGHPIAALPDLAGVEPADIWDAALAPEECSVWNARVFPAVSDPLAYRDWLWLLDPAEAGPEHWASWRAADRYALAEIAVRADHDAFHHRRARIRCGEILKSLPRLLRPDSSLSAGELASAVEIAGEDTAWLAALLDELQRYDVTGASGTGIEALDFSRVLHTAGSVLERVHECCPDRLRGALAGLDTALAPAKREWLDAVGLGVGGLDDVPAWAARAKAFAFEYLGRTIAASGSKPAAPPRSALRQDEIVWGRAPARLDLAGGWTDTPPYSLERGGCVLNAAVDLNGQPPIQAYARVIADRVIRLTSIDFGERTEIRTLDELLDYRHARSGFSLPKAALALAGFSPDAEFWPDGVTLTDMLDAFGGGIELTTLSAIPSGSGLGTSSITGTVLLAVIHRVMGRALTQRELFHGVLRLEQALTTGGGWQDQIGGAVGGAKVITSEPGLVPSPLIRFVPADVLDPHANGGSTLLYYTGLTRLAKDILQHVVARYLNRERPAMATLERIHAQPAVVSEAMARKDPAAFGRALDSAWELKKRLDAGVTNEAIEALLARVRPYVHGAVLLGAGGGGFVLLACKSPKDAAGLRQALEAEPPNERARFFDFNVSAEGLVVTVC